MRDTPLQSSTARQAAIDSSLMSRYWEIIIPKTTATLLQLLMERLPHLDPCSWPGRFKWGGLFVNGIEVKGDISLPSPCRVEYYEPRYNFEDPHSFFPRFEKKFVVFEDDDVLLVFKPEGLPSMPAREQKRYCLKVYADDYVGHPVHMPSRLDMSTAGLVVMSKNPDYHNILQRAFETRRVKKYYLFETDASVEFEKIIVDRPIDRDPEHPVLRQTVADGGKPAVTVMTVVGKGSRESDTGLVPTTFVCAEPLTGRTHQIRVHALSMGIPIVGDKFYQGSPAPTLHLLSYQVVFPHPRTRKDMTVELCPHLIPVWAKFACPT